MIVSIMMMVAFIELQSMISQWTARPVSGIGTARCHCLNWKGF